MATSGFMLARASSCFASRTGAVWPVKTRCGVGVVLSPTRNTFGGPVHPAPSDRIIKARIGVGFVLASSLYLFSGPPKPTSLVSKTRTRGIFVVHYTRLRLPTDTGFLITGGWVADFVGAPRVAMVFEPVRFNDDSGGYAASAWVWSFGDGHTSFQQNPTHYYLAPGLYTVVLDIYMQYRRTRVTKKGYIRVVDGVFPGMRHYFALRMLCPVGRSALLDACLRADGAALDTAMADIADMGKEAVLSTAKSLSDWARVVGVDKSSHLTEVAEAWRARGRLDMAYYEDIASELGYRIGTHAAVGDPHLRLVRGAYPAFRLGAGRIGIDALWDQGPGASRWSVQVRGTDIAGGSDCASSVRTAFLDLSPAWVEFVFIDE